MTTTEQTITGVTEARIAPIARKRRFTSCGYIFTDGVAILQHESVRMHGIIADVEVLHVYPGAIRIESHEYGADGYRRQREPAIDRIVVHDVRLLVHGVSEVTVAFNNTSPASRERGQSVTTIEVLDPKGGVVKEHVIDGLSADLVPQSLQTTLAKEIEARRAYGTTVIEHTGRAK